MDKLKAMPYLRTKLDFYVYSPQLLTDIGEMRTKMLQKLLEIFYFSENPTRGYPKYPRIWMSRANH